MELLRALLAQDRENDYVVLFSDAGVMERTVLDLGLDEARNAEASLVPYGVFSMKSQLMMPSYIRGIGADIFHSTNYMVPMAAFSALRANRTKCVITIHDLIPLLFPDHAPKAKKTRLMPLYRFVMRQVAARADAILTVSENSAHDIRRMLMSRNADHAKVVSAYNGVSDEYRKLAWAPARNPRKLLYVGRLDPYKNVTGLMRIFKGVLGRTSEKVKLVIAGSKDPRYPEAERLAEELGVSEHVEWTGYVTPEKLIALYAEASVLVHPSHYEGFGLPVAEAMAAGLPVVCSSGGSLSEVAGNAACVHEHTDETGFVESICSILDSESKAKELSQLGRSQAEKFTWANAARKTREVYEMLAGGNS